ncbi:PPC domain-containing DNA-binding protein [Rubrobacter calidifluminis]|uniref:PPC domain-containing DNA-binding protein n=1 Tax=Rubrobacter calidifluminis TaxID=1392640 RepID=UPI00235EA687|nr:PPC domain-containing DNA-binding protein [Rubrobacter calidifluminis]
MKARQVHEQRGQRTFVLAFEPGEEVVEGITDFAKENRLDAASLTAIGAFSRATLGYFDVERKEYEEIPVEEQVEVLSLVGDIALSGEEPNLHAHAVVGRRDGSTRGGHLIRGYARPILEVTVIESPEHLRRRTDPETGLALLSPR